MPYINKNERPELDGLIAELASELSRRGIGSVARDGDLNYTISELLCEALDLSDDPRYSKINLAVGVLECVKLELYRRLAAPYEDLKIEENCDTPGYKRFWNWLLSKVSGKGS